MIFSSSKRPTRPGWYWMIGGLGRPVPFYVYANKYQNNALYIDGWGGERRVERATVEWGDFIGDTPEIKGAEVAV